jgi:hypothetical protein
MISIVPGDDQRPRLVDRLGPLGPGAAPGHHQRPDRLHRAIPALGHPGRPAGLRGPRRTDRIHRIGLALPVPVLPVGPVYPDDPDAGRGQVPGQARAVTAGALDAGQADGAEPGKPSRPAYPAAVAGNSMTPSSPPRGSSAAATWVSAWVSAPPVMTRASSTIVIAVPLLWLRDGTCPLAADL